MMIVPESSCLPQQAEGAHLNAGYESRYPSGNNHAGLLTHRLTLRLLVRLYVDQAKNAHLWTTTPRRYCVPQIDAAASLSNCPALAAIALFLVYKPLFDIHRLRFSIAQAMERLNHVNYKRLMEQRLAAMMEEIKAVKKAMKEQVQKTHRYQQEAKENDDALEDIIREGFNRVKGKLEELNHDGSIKINDNNKVETVYNKFQQEELSKVKEQQNVANEKRDDWIEGMRQEFSTEEEAQTDTVAAVIDDSKRVLIVEDELVNQKMMAMILQAEGFKVQVASDGISAIAVAEKWQPHVILMDIRMPKMNGLKVTQKLKSNPVYKDTIIIMLTAHSEKVVVRECLKSGAADFIVKPAKKAELLERIEHFLSGGD